MMWKKLTKVNHLYLNLAFGKSETFADFYQKLQTKILELKTQYQLHLKTIYLTGKNLNTWLLPQWATLLSYLAAELNQNNAEVTIELTFNPQWASSHFALWQRFGINRVVWKISNSLTNQQMQLYHQIIKTAKQAGLTNFSLDYQLTSKSLTTASFQKQKLFWMQLAPPHLSFNYHCHLSTFYKSLIGQWLQEQDYQHYEFFSYARTSTNFSQHTICYLTLQNWIGIGNQATSFIKTADNQVILTTKQLNWGLTKTQHLTLSEYYQLLLLQGLTLKSGLELTNDVQLACNYYAEIIKSLITAEKLIIQQNHLKVNSLSPDNWWNILKLISQSSNFTN